MIRILILLLKIVVLGVILWFYSPILEWSSQMALPSHIAVSLLNFLIYLMGGNIVVSIMSALYRRRKKIPPAQTDNVLLGLQNIFYLITVAAPMGRMARSTAWVLASASSQLNSAHNTPCSGKEGFTGVSMSSSNG